MVYGEDKMDDGFLIAINESNFPHIFECLEGLNVFNLLSYFILSQRVSIGFIKFKCLFHISWNKYTIVVDLTLVTVGSFSLLDHSVEPLATFGDVL
jgi:hypothetical protein